MSYYDDYAKLSTDRAALRTEVSNLKIRVHHLESVLRRIGTLALAILKMDGPRLALEEDALYMIINLVTDLPRDLIKVMLDVLPLNRAYRGRTALPPPEREC